MSSTCLSGGSSPYRIDLEIVKCTSTSTTTVTTSSQQTSSPSSTLSESSSIAISTRKPRAPRKRPNQTYNEAVALLSTAYPNIFSSSKPTTKFSSPHHATATPQQLLDSSSSSSSELLLLPCRVLEYYNSGFLLHQPDCSFFMEPKTTNLMMSPKRSTSSNCSSSSSSWEVDSHENSMKICDGYREEDDFDTESILLDEEELIGESIDSIMGGSLTSPDAPTNNNNSNNMSCWYGNNNSKLNLALRRRVSPVPVPVPVVDVLQISPRLNSHSHVSNLEMKPKTNPAGVEKKKKKKKKNKGTVDEDPIVEDLIVAKDNDDDEEEEAAQSGLLHLKLDYEEVLNAWPDDRGTPIPQHISCANGNHISARLAQIDLFSESGVREASVLRYKEKRRSRLFSKKIRYQVRKVNADRRPRMKGRFVRRGNSRREE